jgi:serine protease Do
MQGLGGIEVTDLDARFRRQFDIPGDLRGAIVTAVDPDSRAFDAGLRPGDVIVELNRQKVAGTRELTDAIRKAKGRTSAPAGVEPGGRAFRGHRT